MGRNIRACSYNETTSTSKVQECTCGKASNNNIIQSEYKKLKPTRETNPSIRVIVFLKETNIRSSKSFLSTVVLPEQVRL